MALFTIEVTKSCTSQGILHYGNRYIVAASDLTNAALAVDPIVTNEKVFHSQAVGYLRARVSTLAEGDDSFVTIPLSGAGGRTVSGDNLPAILTVNVAIQVIGFGRPSRKYYHTVVGEADQASGAWTSGYVDDVLAAMADMITDVSAVGVDLSDPDGQAWTEAAVLGRCGTHQFSKRSKRPLI